MEWISADQKPERPGWYKVKGLHGEYEAPFTRTLSGNMIWCLPDGVKITHWALPSPPINKQP